jgi:hypothetical protein
MTNINFTFKNRMQQSAGIHQKDGVEIYLITRPIRINHTHGQQHVWFCEQRIKF